jgi:hypothetical protein
MKLDAEDLEDLRPLLVRMVRETLDAIDSDRDRLGYPEAEAAQRLGIAKHVLADARRRGEIKARRCGKQMVYSRDALLRFLRC